MARMGDLGARLAVAVPAALFAIAIIVAGGGWFAAGLTALGWVCLHELFAMYGETRPPKLAGFLGLAGVVLAALLGDLLHVMIAFAAFFPLLFLVTAITRGATGPGVAIVVLGVAWIGLGLAHAVLLRELPHGGGIVIDVALAVFVGDAGAYFGGRAFGVRPLAPRISPSKTVEGLVAGVTCTVLAAWLAGTYQDWLSHGQALLLGLAVAAVAPLGDLFESFLKRDAGAKDTGVLFGAHGGALDRLDAVLFAAVAGYYVWRALL
jgi:phosphatidate cytidylyltransferase